MMNQEEKKMVSDKVSEPGIRSPWRWRWWSSARTAPWAVTKYQLSKYQWSWYQLKFLRRVCWYFEKVCWYFEHFQDSGGQAQGRRPGQWQTVFCLRPTKVFAPRRQTDTWKTPAVYDSPGLECRMPTSRICEHLSSSTWVNLVYKQSNKSENVRKREINEAVMNK